MWRTNCERWWSRTAMSDWVEMELGEVLTLQRGFDLPKRVRNPGPYPVVSSSGVTGSHNEFKVNPPGVVIGRYGSLGSVHWVTEPFWPLNTGLWVKDFKGNDPRFVSFLLETVAIDGSAAAAVPGVNRNHLHKLVVRLPDLATQRRVAAVLSAIDDLIEVNERRIALLSLLSQSIYHHWMVSAGLGASAFDPASDVSRRPPTGWAISTVDEIGEARRGFSWKRDAESDDGVRVLTIPNIGRRLRPEGGVRIDQVATKDREKFSLRQNDVLMIGSNGNPMRVGQTVRVAADTDALFASFLIRVRADKQKLSPFLLYLQLSSAEFLERLRTGAVGSTGLRNLRISALRNAPVVVPPPVRQGEFDERAIPLFSMMDSLDVQGRRLGGLRELLLSCLVTGQLGISNLDLGILTPTESE